MLSILGALIGFFTSAVPQIVNIWKQKMDYQQELKLLEMQMKFAEMGHQQKLEEVAIQSDVNMNSQIYQTWYSGIKWIDGLNSLIRPVITICFFSFWIYIKCAQYDYGIQAFNGDALQFLLFLWGAEDQAMFAGIIAFYFGNRTFDKLINSRGFYYSK